MREQVNELVLMKGPINDHYEWFGENTKSIDEIMQYSSLNHY